MNGIEGIRAINAWASSPECKKLQKLNPGAAAFPPKAEKPKKGKNERKVLP